jgi:hypothetical protein
MINAIAKFLVLGQTTLSVLFLGWSLMVYLQFNDYGWKEPYKVWETKDSGYRIASVLDRRTAVLHEMYRQKDRALPGVKPALETLRETMAFFPKNHQFYVAELERISTSDEPIKPNQLTWKDGQLVLDSPGKTTGKPLMKTPVAGIDKSTRATRIERDKILDEIKALTPVVAKLTQEVDAITIQLFGTKDDKNNSQEIGLYEILENESIFQNKLREEKDYLTPKYQNALREVESFRDRMAIIRRTLTPVNRPK